MERACYSLICVSGEGCGGVYCGKGEMLCVYGEGCGGVYCGKGEVLSLICVYGVGCGGVYCWKGEGVEVMKDSIISSSSSFIG